MRILSPQQLKTIASASVPTPPSGYVVIFVDTDNKTKQKDSSGVVTDLTATGAGGSGITEEDAIAYAVAL